MYLIEYDDRLLLFDSGTRADVEMVISYIEEKLKRPLSDLKLVAVSHAHPDHSGGAYYFQQRGIPIAGHGQMNELYQGLSGFVTYFVDVILTYLVWSRKKREGDRLRFLFFPRKIYFDYTANPDQSLALFDDWQVLKAHGHTLNDLSFYHPQEGVLYVADNLISSRTGLSAPYPIMAPSAYKESLQRYLKIKPRKLLLAHYGVRDYKEEELQELISSLRGQVRRHLTSLPKILWQFIKRRAGF